MSDRELALVTGGATRIGRAIALRLAHAGFDVAIHYRTSAAAAADLAASVEELGVRAETFAADLAEPSGALGLAADVEAAMGPVAVLVNNASAFHPTPLLATPAAEVAEHLERFHAIHVRSPLLLVRSLAPGMVARGTGAIVCMTDAALRSPRAGFGPYLATKAALAALVKSWARELAPAVRVNGVAPGVILPPTGPGHSASAADLVARVPMGRLGTPEEVAEVVHFLVRGPGFVSGQIVGVTGAE
jgi:pteridine reductase